MYKDKYYIGKRYLGGRTIGYGSYSHVKEAVDNDGNAAALKIIDLRRAKKNALCTFGGQNPNCKVENEILLLSKLCHRNIIKIYQSEWNSKKNKWYIAMELCKYSLEDLMEAVQTKDKFIGLDLNHVQLFFGQIIQAVSYIHENRIAHHDIKPNNFLIGCDGSLKLVDFGSSIELDPDKESSLPYESLGTPMFQAPELVSLEPICENMSRYALDIWAAGITLYYLASGDYPFHGETIFELFREIREYHDGTLSIDYNNIHHPPLLDLVKKMLKPNQQRPTAKEILEHPFLKDPLPPNLKDEHVYEIVEKIMNDFRK